MTLSIGVNTAMFDGLDNDLAFATIREAGFACVELAYNQGYVGNLSPDLFGERHAEYICALLEKYQLTTHTLGATMNLAADGALEAFRGRIRFAAMIGASRLTICPGRRVDRPTIVERLKALAEDAARHRCTICIENGGDPNYDLFARADDGYALLAEVASPALAFNIDAGNMVSLCPQEDAIAQAIAMVPGAAHCHIKDVKKQDGRYTFPAIGDGDLHYQPLLQALAEKGVPCSLEIPLRMYRRADSYPVRADQPVEAQRSLAILRRSRQALAPWLA